MVQLPFRKHVFTWIRHALGNKKVKPTKLSKFHKILSLRLTICKSTLRLIIHTTFTTNVIYPLAYVDWNLITF